MSASTPLRPALILAVDYPNVQRTLLELYGPNLKIDWIGLKRQLVTIGLDIIGFDISEVDIKAHMLMQRIHEPSSARAREVAIGRNRMKNELSLDGWTFYVKPTYQATPELSSYVSRLSQALQLIGRREIQYLRSWKPDADSNTSFTLRGLADNALKNYSPLLSRWDKAALRILKGRSLTARQQQMLVNRLLCIYEAIIKFEFERRDPVLREVLTKIVKSPLVDLLKDVKSPDGKALPGLNEELIEAYPPTDLPHLAKNVVSCLQAVDNAEKRVRDIDDDLNRWVAEQAAPMYRARQPGVVFLIGNDIMNHKLVAERVRRYHLAVRFVLFREMYEKRVGQDGLRAIARYSGGNWPIFLDDYIVHETQLANEAI